MATINELHAQGHQRIRLPDWNEFAYVELQVLEDGRLGPWPKVYDVNAGIGGGEPVLVLLAEADRDNRWEVAEIAPHQGSSPAPHHTRPEPQAQ